LYSLFLKGGSSFFKIFALLILKLRKIEYNLISQNEKNIYSYYFKDSFLFY